MPSASPTKPTPPTSTRTWRTSPSSTPAASARTSRRTFPAPTSIHGPLPDGPLVVYCWGPGCNGATKACARLSDEGRDVKEMLGGFEYWVREGFAIEGTHAGELSEKMAQWTLLSELCSVSATHTAPVM